jgi:hypothetical protein
MKPSKLGVTVSPRKKSDSTCKILLFADAEAKRAAVGDDGASSVRTSTSYALRDWHIVSIEASDASTSHVKASPGVR